VVVFVAVLALRFSFQKEYVVHKSGVIVITGASSGIGRHAAVSLAKAGYTVFAGVRSEKDKASITSEGIAGLRGVIVDVTAQSTIESSFEEVSSFLAKHSLPLVGIVNK
jgi:NAD(P)-dependent dehydrogenase (short-subunit alcohol dehydrogenase family)